MVATLRATQEQQHRVRALTAIYLITVPLSYGIRSLLAQVVSPVVVKAAKLAAAHVGKAPSGPIA